MSTNTRLYAVVCLLAGNLCAQTPATPAPINVQVEGGVVQFDSDTNLPVVSVHGKSTTLRADVRAGRVADGLEIEQIQATLQVKSISTGMGLRDEHMRKYIFTKADGSVPDLQFKAANLRCAVQAGKETPCAINGTLSIRGIEKPFAITLKVKQDGGSTFKAAGSGAVKLSDYGIERPSQLGVQTEDEVKLSIQFTGREAVVRASTGGSKQ
ncbi:MAG: YceI family protein [Bryobacteraceae bacterium]